MQKETKSMGPAGYTERSGKYKLGNKCVRSCMRVLCNLSQCTEVLGTSTAELLLAFALTHH